MDAVAVLLGGVAAAIALAQLWAGLKATKVQRVIDLHRDFTTGEVGAARDRFTTLMWKHGEQVGGRNVCHRPRWDEILTNVLGESSTRGVLGAYPADEELANTTDAEPMRDLYAVLWCFERIEAGRSGRALDRRMIAELLADHAVWWDELTSHLRTEHTSHVSALRRLAKAVEGPDLRASAAQDFEGSVG